MRGVESRSVPNRNGDVTSAVRFWLSVEASKHRVGQLQPQKPAVGDIDLDLAHQLPFRANPKQVADEQRLEHHRRIERRASVVRAIKSGNPIMDKGKIDHRVDLAKQLILRNQTVETYHLQRGLLRRGFAKHAPMNQKSPPKARTLSAVWRPAEAGLFFWLKVIPGRAAARTSDAHCGSGNPWIPGLVLRTVPE